MQTLHGLYRFGCGSAVSAAQRPLSRSLCRCQHWHLLTRGSSREGPGCVELLSLLQAREELELSFVKGAEMVFTTLSSTGRRIFEQACFLLFALPSSARLHASMCQDTLSAVCQSLLPAAARSWSKHCAQAADAGPDSCCAAGRGLPRSAGG